MADPMPKSKLREPARTDRTREQARLGRKVDHDQIAGYSLVSTISRDEHEKLVRYNRNYARIFGDIAPTSLGNYAVGRLIGTGAFAEVSLATHKLTQQAVAIKTINKKYMQDAAARMKVMQEVNIHRKMGHPNVIRYSAVSSQTL